MVELPLVVDVGMFKISVPSRAVGASSDPRIVPCSLG